MTSQVALLFPGQGSQSVGMMDALAAEFSEVRSTFDEASEAVGVDLWALATGGPAEQLNQTENTQPALLAAGIATWRIWQSLDGPEPDVMAGHSLGEYTALVAGGSMSLADGAALVAARGRAMQEAVAPGAGAMAAILGLEEDQIAAVCDDVPGVVSAANINCPGQIVIAGEYAAVEAAIEKLKAAGAKAAIPLDVSVPSHCALMRPAADKLADRLEPLELSMPLIPVYHNVDAQVAESVAGIRERLLSQLYSPVRWSQTISGFQSTGIAHFVECGPGKVLTGLMRRIDRRAAAHALLDRESMEKAIAGINDND